MLQGSGLKEQVKQQVLSRLRDPNLPGIGSSGLVEHVSSSLGEGGGSGGGGGGHDVGEDRGPASRRVAGE